jgi:hypothetical protein
MSVAPLPRALAAEAIGTFALVFAGAGAVMVDAKTHALGHVGVAITFGLVIMAMIYAVGLRVAATVNDEGRLADACGRTIGLLAAFLRQPSTGWQQATRMLPAPNVHFRGGRRGFCCRTSDLSRHAACLRKARQARVPVVFRLNCDNHGGRDRRID